MDNNSVVGMVCYRVFQLPAINVKSGDRVADYICNDKWETARKRYKVFSW